MAGKVVSKKAKNKTLGKANNDHVSSKRLTIDLPAFIHTKLKVTSAKKGKSMGEIIKKLLEDNLDN